MLAGWGAALFGFLTTIYLFRPGFMTNDPVAQLAEARAGIYTDLHPPIMALLWHWIDFVVPGPLGMLLVHNLLFWGALGLFGCLLFAVAWKRVLFVWAFGFFPSVFVILGMIWKDVGMGVSFLLGCALLLLCARTKSKLAYAFSIFLFLYGFLVRPNALPAVIPLLFWSGAVAQHWLPKGHLTTLKIASIGCALMTGAFLILNIALGACLAQGPRHFTFQPILIYDLSAISSALGTNEFPSYMSQLNPGLTPQYIREHYNTIDVGTLLFSGGNYQVTDPTQIEQLKKRWFEAVSAHKKIYLKHRLKCFVSLLSLDRTPFETFSFYVVPDAKAPPTVFSSFHQRLLEGVAKPSLDWVRTKTPLFRNGVYFLLIPLLLLFARFTGKKPGIGVMSIGASGFGYTLAYLVIGPGAIFRYSWWTLLTSLLLVPMIWGEDLNASSQDGEIGPLESV